MEIMVEKSKIFLNGIIEALVQKYCILNFILRKILIHCKEFIKVTHVFNPTTGAGQNKGVGNFTASIPQEYLDDIFGSCSTTKLTLFGGTAEDEEENPTEKLKNHPQLDLTLLDEIQHYVSLQKLDIFGGNTHYSQELRFRYNNLLKGLVQN